MVDSILRVGTKNLGPAPVALKKALSRLSLEDLRETLDVLLDSTGWKALSAWVKSRV
jgi:hypothetical protein